MTAHEVDNLPPSISNYFSNIKAHEVDALSIFKSLLKQDRFVSYLDVEACCLPEQMLHVALNLRACGR